MFLVDAGSRLRLPRTNFGRKHSLLPTRDGGCSSMAERELVELDVASSTLVTHPNYPIIRSNYNLLVYLSKYKGNLDVLNVHLPVVLDSEETLHLCIDLLDNMGL